MKTYTPPYRSVFLAAVFGLVAFSFLSCQGAPDSLENLLKNFIKPPNSARPGVYWYFMDGNLSREEMTADLESMKAAGIGHVLFLEVNVGVPRGHVDFLSEKWQELFAHAVHEAERLGIELVLGVGPGWSGSGGPWVKPGQSMLHLVASSVTVEGPGRFKSELPVPPPKRPYFGERALTPELRKKWLDYYEDQFVLAFPTPPAQELVEESEDKALYYRAPYTSRPGVKPFFSMPAEFPAEDSTAAIDRSRILDISDRLHPDGVLEWEVPPGQWTIMRFGSRNNGAVTRPAPQPGLGFEANKMDTTDFKAHFDRFVGRLIDRVGPKPTTGAGWTMLHMDSWEMGAQNWTHDFREQFLKRRGYDPLPFLPAYAGLIVESREVTERFLWDLRLTAQELVLERHAQYIKKLGRKYGFRLSIEPYDMNPCADLDLGDVADIPMCEFWSKGFGFNSAFSCFEASSIAHVNGLPVVAAEAFTASGKEAWKLYPGAIKNQGDWAFATGINRFFYHTFAHKSLGDKYRPGMTMGPYGVHWDRGQTWWPMVGEYHKYIARCSYMLQQGRTVADVLYLTPEGAPHVFRPPASATVGNDTIPDRRGYNFDGCSPNQLMRASVRDGKIVFPGGAEYRLLVLPQSQTMTPQLLDKIKNLVKSGAQVYGNPPAKSSSLAGYPQCDSLVQEIAQEMWGQPSSGKKIKLGAGTIYFHKGLTMDGPTYLYPGYEITADILGRFVPEDFSATGPIRYTHRTTENLDIYFLSNRADSTFEAQCQFRVAEGTPELWDPLTGKTRPLPDYEQNGVTRLPLYFAPYQSYFIIFNRTKSGKKGKEQPNFVQLQPIAELKGPWKLSFDPRWGGPDSVAFSSLEDWTTRPEPGIKYYSGIAVYRRNFDLPPGIEPNGKGQLFLDLGTVHVMARVKLNGTDLGVLWTAPWKVEITDVVREAGNRLEIEVANLWPNRLIGDEQFPDDGVRDGKWPDWLLNGEPRPSGRLTFTTRKFYSNDSPLLPSGLIGPVQILESAKR